MHIRHLASKLEQVMMHAHTRTHSPSVGIVALVLVFFLVALVVVILVRQCDLAIDPIRDPIRSDQVIICSNSDNSVGGGRTSYYMIINSIQSPPHCNLGTMAICKHEHNTHKNYTTNNNYI